MNFLAHFHLAWPDEGLIAGALEGDYYKGPVQEHLAADLARGIRLHRAIDAYTDEHPLVAQLRREFPPGLRRCAGILIDLSFDHYLSSRWESYHRQPLEQFREGVYRILRRRDGEFSSGARHMSARILEHDILGLYGEWETVTRSAARIGERFRRGNPLLDVARDLEPLRPALERSFRDFYPQLQAFAARRAEQLLQDD